MHTFFEQCYIYQGVDAFAKATEALGGETSDIMQTPAFVNTKLYDKVVAIATGFSVVSTHVVRLRLLEATASDGSGSTTVSGKSKTYTSTATADEFTIAVEINAEELSTGYQYVGADVYTDDADGSEAAVILLLPMNPRYPQASLSAAT